MLGFQQVLRQRTFPVCFLPSLYLAFPFLLYQLISNARRPCLSGGKTCNRDNGDFGDIMWQNAGERSCHQRGSFAREEGSTWALVPLLLPWSSEESPAVLHQLNPALSPLCSFSFCVSTATPLLPSVPEGKGCAPLAFICPTGLYEADGWGNPLVKSARWNCIILVLLLRCNIAFLNFSFALPAEDPVCVCVCVSA